MDPLDESSSRGPQDSDADVGSPAASSNYSSCDGSELDRYCSANSALGSASICSSVGNYSELLDSLKNSHRWNGFDGFPDGGGVETPRENGKDVILMGGMSSSSRIRTGSKLFLKSAENASSPVKGKSVENAMNSAIGSGSYEEEIGFSGNLSCEDSEGEESSIDYGSGDESRIQFVKRNNLQCSKEIASESGNPLFMNSLVAFGADDWDEFEQERGADGLGSMSLYEDRVVQQHPSTGHVDGPSVIEKETDAETVRDSEVSSLQISPSEENSKEGCSKIDQVVRRETASAHIEEVSGFDAAEVPIKQTEDESELTITPLCNGIYEQSFNALNRAFEGKDTEAEEVDGFSCLLPIVGIGRDLALESTAVGNSYSTDMVGKDHLSDEVS